MIICTATARSCLSHARVLASSVARHHKGTRLQVLVLDEPQHGHDSLEPGPSRSGELFDVIRPIELDIPGFNWMAAAYRPHELIAAVKPWLISHLAQTKEETVIYLGVDSQVWSPLDEIAERAESGVVLVPHVSEQLPRDECWPDEPAVMQVGAYDLGILAVSPTHLEAMTFLKERTATGAKDIRSKMLYLDQRWADLIPGIFPVEIMRDPHVSVSPWNLHEKDLEFRKLKTKSVAKVGGSDLLVSRYFGFDSAHPHLPAAWRGAGPHELLSYVLEQCHVGKTISEPPETQFRVSINDPGPLRAFLGQYAQELLAAGRLSLLGRPFGAVAGGPAYGLADTPSGIRVDHAIRELYWQALYEAEIAESKGEAPPKLPPDPFDPEQSSALVEWLNEPAPIPYGRSSLSRYLSSLHAVTPLLHALFPRPSLEDLGPFISWCESTISNESGPRPSSERLVSPVAMRLRRSGAIEPAGQGTGEYGITPLLQKDSHSVAASVAAKDGIVDGVNVMGYFTSTSGVAENARLLTQVLAQTRLGYQVIAAKASQEPFVLLSREPGQDADGSAFVSFAADVTPKAIGVGADEKVGRVSARKRRYLEFTKKLEIERQLSGSDRPTGHLAKYPVSIVCINADQFGLFYMGANPKNFAGHYNIGIWAWELEEFPASMHGAFGITDEVWAISEFTSASVSRHSPVPVHTFPPVIEVPPVDMSLTRADFEIPDDDFVYLFCFDMNSVMERKNPVGLIEAFTRATRDNQAGVSLVIKVLNADKNPVDAERLRRLVRQTPGVKLIERELKKSQTGALMNMADCYVSLHRAEGFGLTMAESMALGKPVIGTAYSGNMDFMNPGNSLLVPYKPASVPDGCHPYEPGAIWADPDTDEAAKLMAQVRNDPELRERLGQAAKKSVLDAGAINARAKFIEERIESVSRSISMQAPSERLKAIQQRALDLGESSPLAPAVVRARKAINKAIWPQLNRQAELNEAIASELDSLRVELERIEARLSTRETPQG